ncbi:DHRS4 reductase, partial [Polypterus senegalus]
MPGQQATEWRSWQFDPEKPARAQAFDFWGKMGRWLRPEGPQACKAVEQVVCEGPVNAMPSSLAQQVQRHPYKDMPGLLEVLERQLAIYQAGRSERHARGNRQQRLDTPEPSRRTAEAPQRPKEKPASPHCYKCGETGHLLPTCSLNTTSEPIDCTWATAERIGFATARSLALEGASVVLSSRHEENVERAVAELRHENLNVTGTTCNAGKSADREKLISKAVKEYGGIDILVSNAGFNPFFGNILDTTEDMWDKFLGPYSVSKTALLGLTKALALELAPLNVRVNCVAPGLIKTNFSSAVSFLFFKNTLLLLIVLKNLQFFFSFQLWKNEKYGGEFLKNVSMKRYWECHTPLSSNLMTTPHALPIHLLTQWKSHQRHECHCRVLLEPPASANKDVINLLHHNTSIGVPCSMMLLRVLEPGSSDLQPLSFCKVKEHGATFTMVAKPTETDKILLANPACASGCIQITHDQRSATSWAPINHRVKLRKKCLPH